MLEKLRQKRWFFPAAVISLTILALGSRVCVAHFLATDEPGDGVLYSRLAKNLLEQNVYSLDAEVPFSPTLVRVPGYPMFLAGIYSVFGHENNTAVRAIQAVFDTATCLMAGILATLWTADEERKRRNGVFAFLLAALCPFIVIYSATLLTETLTTFLMTALALTATVAFGSVNVKGSLFLWAAAGVIAGAAVLLRPDSGLFAAAVGITIVVSGLLIKHDSGNKFRRRILSAFVPSAIFTLAFVIVLTPWTARNYRVFGVFQPLAPAHAEMPGEFVAHGYFKWARTWIDDSHFVEPILWNLGERPIRIGAIPTGTFDSPEERARVAALLYRYNNPPGSEGQYASGTADEDDDTEDAAADDASDAGETAGDNADATEDPDDDDPDKTYTVKMTPEIDAQFGELADERIARSRLRYYLFLPAKRGAALWFDTHSLYYPFGGQISPVKDLDYDVNQQYWLPVFLTIDWIYTLLAFAGAIVLWRNRAEKGTLRWLILIALMTLPRIAFFASIENPEPRYVVELFVFAAILGGIFLGGLKRKKEVFDEMPEPAPASGRLLSLDAFRGFTIAAMTLVNNPGTWSAIYPPLEHSAWHGVTPTDLVFPFFLFAVGVSIPLALGRKRDAGVEKREIHLKILKRAALIFLVGLFLELFPFYNPWTGEWFDPATVRIMGVLQRIAVCYLVAALIFLHTGWKRQAIIAAVLLLAYWALMTLVAVPGCEVFGVDDKGCNLAAYIDRSVLGVSHLWNQAKVFDPEGLLSTLPSIGTTLAGVLTGNWLRSERDSSQKFSGMLAGGFAVAAAGWIWSFWFPLNKSLWTSSYAIYTAGIAAVFLALCYWVIDLKGYRKWSVPFLIFGSNAIALYIGSTIMAKALDIIQLSGPNDQPVSLQEKIFNGLFLPLAEPINASLLFAIAFVLVWLLLMWLLYRKQIFIKI